MDSFFFIPGSKLSNLDMVKSLGVSDIIIDLEDALKESDRASMLTKLGNHQQYANHYIRVPLVNTAGNAIDTQLLQDLLEAGYRKFVFPKIGSYADFANIINAVQAREIQIILLIETPQLFLEAKELLLNYKSFISGVGLGSHDFMSVVGGTHELENLSYARQHILYLARMINALAIDIASMELSDKALLTQEILDGFKKGYDAKFFIHPWQVTVLREIKFYSEEEYQWAISIMNELNKIGKEEEFEPVVVNGQVIEKAHLNRAKKILTHYKDEGK